MRKCREWIFLHFLSISSFSLHFLFISSFSRHFLAARLQGCNNSCSPDRHYYSTTFLLSGWGWDPPRCLLDLQFFIVSPQQFFIENLQIFSTHQTTALSFFLGGKCDCSYNFSEIQYLYRQLSLCFRRALLVLKEKCSYIFMKKLWVGIFFCAL